MIKSLFVLHESQTSDWDHWLEAYINNKNLTDHYLEISKGKRTLLDRVLSKISFPLKLHGNYRLFKLLKTQNFDLLILLKPIYIFPFILKHFKGKIFCIPQDNMVKNHNNSKLFIKNIKYFDAIFLMKGYEYSKDFYSIKNKQNIFFWYHSYSMKRHRPLNLNNFKYDVTFIGSYEKVRFEYLNFIAENGITINVFGNNWNLIREYSNNLIIHNVPVYKERYIKTLCESKININFLRKIQNDTQTTRSFEIPACKAFMISERSLDHLDIFKEDKEAIYFDTKHELLDKIKIFLNSESKRNEIIMNAYLKLNKKFTYDGKFDFLTEKFKELNNK